MTAQTAQSSKKPKTAITPTREEDFPLWYQEVVKAADMAEHAPVRGCMIIKPYGYALWENMQRIFDDRIKALGVQNAYFPLLIPLEFMSREAEHIDGFAKECAVVTHHRLEADPDGKGLRPAPDSKLEEPYIIRPTSETIIGDAMSRWIQSYRDLPLKLNQWCNVMRWEMRTRLFLRTSEFLWQEGHNVFESAEQAEADALKMLNEYVSFCEETLALPSIPGMKTEDEKFPGAEKTFTFEMMMQDGKALQSGTSHFMGQNFAKSMGITFQSREGTEEHAYTTSWGITTRLIGALIMMHADDDGMIMPPRAAPVQVGIIPIIRDDQDQSKIMEYAGVLKSRLRKQGIRVHLDDSEARTPDKMWAMVKKGVPIRVEIGLREVEENKLTHVRRDIGRESKTSQTVEKFLHDVNGILDDIHSSLFNKAKEFMDTSIKDVSELDELESLFKGGHVGFASMDAELIHEQRYEDLKKGYALSSRCLPLTDNGKRVLVGKSY